MSDPTTDAPDGRSLTLEGVTRRFDGERAVADFSVAVETGERVAIVGPSGAGKTTLLRLAAGAIRPDGGRVLVGGDPVARGDVALAYQGETLVDRRTALANVLAGRLAALPWWRSLVEPLSPRDPDPALELLDAVGLAEKADARADELSAGERQRVALARALVQDAPVVLADEPTANLDPSSRETVLDVLDRVAGDRTLVTVLHDVDLARDRYDRVVGLADGRLQFDRAAADVSDEALAELFGAETSGRADTEAAVRSGADGERGEATESTTRDESAEQTDPDPTPEREPRWYA